MQEHTHLDEDLLNKAIEIAFGPQAPQAIMKLYNALHDEYAAGREDGWNAGYEMGFNDGFAAEIDALPLMEEARAAQVAKRDDEYQANAAQLAMDTLWGHEPTLGALAD